MRLAKSREPQDLAQHSRCAIPVFKLYPDQLANRWEQAGRRIEVREVKDLDFTDPRLGKVRVVVSDEHWVQTKEVGGKRVRIPKQSHWRWLASPKLNAVPARVIHQAGHGRWGIENHAFNELTQY